MEEEGEEETRPAWLTGAFSHTRENTTVPQKLPTAPFPPPERPGRAGLPGSAPHGLPPAAPRAQVRARRGTHAPRPAAHLPQTPCQHGSPKYSSSERREEEDLLQQDYKSPGRKVRE